MLLPNPGRNDIGAKAAIYFKTSYVITKPRKKARSFIRRQNFKTSYVITKRSRNYWRSGRYVISKHHMLLPNLYNKQLLLSSFYFKTSYVITKPLRTWGGTSFVIFQNIICYYQTLLDVLWRRRDFCISKHHMLLPN